MKRKNFFKSYVVYWSSTSKHCHRFEKCNQLLYETCYFINRCNETLNKTSTENLKQSPKVTKSIRSPEESTKKKIRISVYVLRFEIYLYFVPVLACKTCSEKYRYKNKFTPYYFVMIKSAVLFKQQHHQVSLPELKIQNIALPFDPEPHVCTHTHTCTLVQTE